MTDDFLNATLTEEKDQKIESPPDHWRLFAKAVQEATTAVASDASLTLSPEQEAASAFDFGRTSVVATAGSGKTTVMALTMAGLVRAVRDGAGEPIGIGRGEERRLLGFSFTRDASLNLSERLSGYLGGRGKYSVRTMHGWCLDLLLEHHGVAGWGAPPDVIDQDMATRRLARLAGEHWEVKKRRDLPVSLDDLQEAFTELDEAEAEGEDALLEKIPLRLRGEVKALRVAYRTGLKKDHVIDFDSALWAGLTVLKKARDEAGGERVRNSLPYFLFVDEAQDLSLLQWEIVRELSLHVLAVSVIGDDDQAIYRWRGARPEYFLDYTLSRGVFQVEDDKMPRRRLDLGDNRRSLSDVVTLADSVIKRIPSSRRLVKKLSASRGGRGTVSYLATPSYEEALTLIISDIRRETMERRATPGDFAVLFRAARGQKAFQKIQAALLLARIPFQVSGGTSALQMPEISFARSLLSLSRKTPDGIERSEFWQDTFERVGISEGAAEKIVLETVKNAAAGIDPLAAAERAITNSRVKGDGKKLGLEIVAVVRACRTFPSAGADFVLDTGVGLIQAVSQLAAKKIVVREASRGGGRTDEQIEAEAGDIYDERFAVYREVREVVSGLGVMEAAQLISTDVKTREAQRREGGVVSVSTVHQAKGLEWKKVWVIGAVDGEWPRRYPGMEVGDDEEYVSTGDSGQREIFSAKDDEETRLFYVAATRAKDELVIIGSYNPGPEVSLPNGTPEASPYLPSGFREKTFHALEIASGPTSVRFTPGVDDQARPPRGAHPSSNKGGRDAGKESLPGSFRRILPPWRV